MYIVAWTNKDGTQDTRSYDNAKKAEKAFTLRHTGGFGINEVERVALIFLSTLNNVRVLDNWESE